ARVRLPAGAPAAARLGLGLGSGAFAVRFRGTFVRIIGSSLGRGAIAPIAMGIRLTVAAVAPLFGAVAAFAALLAALGLLLETLVLVALFALAPVLLEARAILVDDAEIMVRELEIIFGVDPVALHLRVTRQILVFLEQLGGVAARAVV